MERGVQGREKGEGGRVERGYEEEKRERVKKKRTQKLREKKRRKKGGEEKELAEEVYNATPLPKTT